MGEGLLRQSCAIIVLLLSTSLASATSAVQFVSHRAVYDLSLDRAKQSSVESAKGRIVFELIGSKCEGYAQNFRQLIELQGAELGTRLIDSRSTTFEEGDGSGLTFSNKTESSFNPSEQTDGRAEKSAGRVTIKTSAPVRAVVDYSQNVLFPMEHYEKLIETAKSGGKTLTATLFDGSEDGTKLSDTFAVIGNTITDQVDEVTLISPDLGKIARWPITISYFDHAGTQVDTPNYSMFVELFENGVARNLRLDYGDFSLIGKLKSIDFIQTPPCAAE